MRCGEELKVQTANHMYYM